MNTFRPDPDALLTAVQKEEQRHGRGKLKIFFGMAAGVGKTYTMLDTARQLKSEGVDVVVGYVETHKRHETEALLDGLEVMPRRKVEYRGTTLEEMDLDAVLARRPRLVLVDELAHTNAPGVRHAKRYQDIIELLEAGIDVYTTVNVQHFESRADDVRRITDITIHETVPDSVLDLADEIELIDLSPDELRKRLSEGKVYTPERIEVAANNFFRTGNLTALREMALRLTAEHVDHQLQDYMQLKQIAGPWRSGERLMVAVGTSPFSERLIRWTRRMAYNLEAPWIAVHIETTRSPTPEEQERLARNLALARDLGGEVVVATGHDVARSLLHIAHQRNVSQIVTGKPAHNWFQMVLRGGSLTNRLIRASGDIDVYIVTGDKAEAQTRPRVRFAPSAQHSSWQQYVWALVLVAAITAIDLYALPFVGYQAVGLTELVAVLLIAVYLGRGPALLAATVTAISWNYLFINPRFTFEISRVQDVILFIFYFVIAIFTGNLTARIRQQEQRAQHNADRTMALYTLAHETATAVDMDEVLRTAVVQIGRVFDAHVAILLPQHGKLSPHPHPCSSLHVSEKDASVAAWVYEHGKPAGRFTNTLASANAQYLPLRTPNRTVGVVGIQTKQHIRLAYDQEVLLETFINQVALVIEREMLDEAAQQSAMLRESERLYTTLLNSISHELRTPIATIEGAASSLLDPRTAMSDEARMALTTDIRAAAERLNRLVENLLDMSRLESGRVQIKREWCDIREVIGVAVQHFTACFRERPLIIQAAPDVPLIHIDFVLIEQVLTNLFDNVCSYTPPGTSVTITTQVRTGALEVVVADTGPGIPADALEHLFDKFYRVPGTFAGGTGLGLSICRGLVEVHGGTLTVDSRPEGGTRFTMRLPANGIPPPVQEAWV